MSLNLDFYDHLKESYRPCMCDSSSTRIVTASNKNNFVSTEIVQPYLEFEHKYECIAHY